jgi:hypothetical protein
MLEHDALTFSSFWMEHTFAPPWSSARVRSVMVIDREWELEFGRGFTWWVRARASGAHFCSPSRNYDRTDHN